MEILDMSDVYPKVVETILDSDYKDDKTALATLSILTMQARISELSLFALTIKGKKVTDKRRETITALLTDIVFYTTILLWICDLDPDNFTFDAIEAFSEEFSDDYQTETILCLNMAMASSADLLELVFDDAEFMDAIQEIEEPTDPSLALEADPSSDPDEPEEIPEGELAQHVATILACTMMVAQQMDDTDFDTILYNVTTISSDQI